MDIPVLDLDSSDGLSDEDWDRSMFRRNPNIGKRQAEIILARQAEDRPASKRNYRKLALVWGAPSTQATTARVERTWEAFCQSIGHE